MPLVQLYNTGQHMRHICMLWHMPHMRNDIVQRWESNVVQSSDSLQKRPFSKWELLLKERICSHRERILSFMSSSLWYENHFYPIRWPPLIVTISITQVCDLRNGSYANVLSRKAPFSLCRCRHGTKSLTIIALAIIYGDFAIYWIHNAMMQSDQHLLY